MTKENHKTEPPVQARVIELRVPSCSKTSSRKRSLETFISDNLQDFANYKKVNTSSEWSSFKNLIGQ